jgi:hypothetical protein
MVNTLFPQHANAIRNFSGDVQSRDLLLAAEGPLAVYYAPFDWVNTQARVVLVGITPGHTQALNALNEAKRQLLSGATEAEALRRAKQCGAFSGELRTSLVAMLNHIGLQNWLGVPSCDPLFGSAYHLIQTTSVLPYPVFRDGENYSSSPPIMSTPRLRRYVLESFVPLTQMLPDAVFVPLGSAPTKVLAALVKDGLLNQARVLTGLPHPSRENS